MLWNSEYIFVTVRSRLATILLELWLTDIEGGPLESKYELKQFHFHWGDTNSVGSEHVIGDKVFAAEVSQSVCIV